MALHALQPRPSIGRHSPRRSPRRLAGTFLLTLLFVLAALGGCAKMRLGEAMLGTNEPDEKIYGQLFAVGGAGEAEIGPDGVAHATIGHELHESIFRPSIIMVDRPGRVELEFRNRNPQNHLLVMVQSDGNMQALSLPPLTTGTITAHFGTPGMYLFMDAMGNHMGRGMMGMILVEGQVPEEARLDRPPQPQP